ncbi:MAG: MATE family efflux transporter [Lachnospiraceae bacterium]|nr:MATE family efflux transporter [Lachnospiraceae bacterium]
MKEKLTMNKMGTLPVPKLMLSMGIPMILSMVLQACYNIVDGMFVARMPDMPGVTGAGEYAVNALTLAFPVQMLIVAFGIGTGVGVNALLAKSLGQKEWEKVGRAAGNGVFLGLVIYAVFVLFGIVGIDDHLKSQTKDAVILDMGKTYLSICTFLCFGIVMFSVYEKLLQATGKTVLSTIAQVAGAITNIVLDPVLIFGYAGFPQMGIAGAAWATVIGQMVSFVLAAMFHYGKNKEVPSGLCYIKPEREIIREIYTVGLPAIIMQALMSFMTYGVNIILGGISTAAVTAYGIFYKIQQFIFFAGFGLRDAITPIVSYNYGMGNRERVKSGIRYGILYTMLIMGAGLVGLQIFADPLVAVFGLSDETAILCCRAIRIISLGFFFAGGNIALQGVFQALGCGLSSLVVSVLRLCVIVLPLAWWFSKFQNADFIVWFAFLIAEAVAFAAAAALMVRADRNLIQQMRGTGL